MESLPKLPDLPILDGDSEGHVDSIKDDSFMGSLPELKGSPEENQDQVEDKSSLGESSLDAVSNPSHGCESKLEDWRDNLPEYQAYKRGVVAFDSLSADPGSSGAGTVEGLVAMTQGVKELGKHWEGSMASRLFESAKERCQAKMSLIPEVLKPAVSTGSSSVQVSKAPDEKESCKAPAKPKEFLESSLLSSQKTLGARLEVLLGMSQANKEALSSQEKVMPKP